MGDTSLRLDLHRFGIFVIDWTLKINVVYNRNANFGAQGFVEDTS